MKFLTIELGLNRIEMTEYASAHTFLVGQSELNKSVE